MQSTFRSSLRLPTWISAAVVPNKACRGGTGAREECPFTDPCQGHPGMPRGNRRPRHGSGTQSASTWPKSTFSNLSISRLHGTHSNKQPWISSVALTRPRCATECRVGLSEPEDRTWKRSGPGYRDEGARTPTSVGAVGVPPSGSVEVADPVAITTSQTFNRRVIASRG
jgi:hypothetical protein